MQWFSYTTKMGLTPTSQPTHQAVMTLFDSQDGRLAAIIDADHITSIRTAAVAVLSTQLVARSDSSVLTVIGTGVQAMAHLEVFPKIFSFSEVRIVGKNQSEEMRLARLFNARPMRGDFYAAAVDADVVCCCTAATSPILDETMISAGVHITSVGSGRELAPGLISTATVFVEWRGAASYPPPAGAAELQGIDLQSVTELGEVALKKRAGREYDAQNTVYKSTGHVVEDLVTARQIVDRARREGVGITVTL